MTIQEFFKDDRFAADAGIDIVQAEPGYARTRLTVVDRHLNAGHRAQGGALFTLADLAVAVAANTRGRLAFSLSGSINFLRAARQGDTLTAEARERHLGRTTALYQVDITDQDGRLVATFESSMFRTDSELPEFGA